MQVFRVPAIALCCALLTLLLWGCAAQVTLPDPQTAASPAQETTVPAAIVATPDRRLTPVAPLTTGVPLSSQPSAMDGPRVTILYTNDGRGKIDPCG